MPVAEGVCSRYLSYLHAAGYYVRLNTRSIKQSTGIQNLDSSSYLAESVSLPRFIEQRAISEFLDRETAALDALAAKKERLIKLLQEKYASLLANAILGAPCYSEVRLGYYVDLLPGFAFPSAGFSRDPDDVRLLRGVNVSPGALRWDDVVRWPKSEAAKFSRYQLREGDLVLGMDRPWVGSGIRVSFVLKADLPSLLLQRVARLRARNGLLQEYLGFVLASPQFQEYFEPILTGVSVPHISPDQVGAFRLRLPSVEVQELVCRHLSEERRRIDALSKELIASIERLKEIRTAIIWAAVTGKIDVRKEVP